MSGAPLTEDRFVELFDTLLDKSIKQYLNPIMAELKAIKSDIGLLQIQTTDLRNFQNLESKAIEYELRQVLDKYLKEKYQHMTIKPFEMREIKDPITFKPITELDGAFLFYPYVPKVDMKRIADSGLPYVKKMEKIDERPTIFLLAEAKHFINRNKIAEKLNQLDKIITFFNAAKNVYANIESKLYSPKFMDTVRRNNYITNIQSYMLFFCASFWEENVMDAFSKDVQERKQMVDEFISASPERKIKLYKQIRNLEAKWYKSTHINLPDNQIVALKDVEGAMAHVQFVLPSGDRYHVHELTQDVKPIGTMPIGGKQTRKRFSKKMNQ